MTLQWCTLTLPQNTLQSQRCMLSVYNVQVQVSCEKKVKMHRWPACQLRIRLVSDYTQKINTSKYAYPYHVSRITNYVSGYYAWQHAVGVKI